MCAVARGLGALTNIARADVVAYEGAKAGKDEVSRERSEGLVDARVTGELGIVGELKSANLERLGVGDVDAVVEEQEVSFERETLRLRRASMGNTSKSGRVVLKRLGDVGDER